MAAVSSGRAARAVEAGTALTDTRGKSHGQGHGQGHGALAGSTALAADTAGRPGRG
ncbi:hypothetical protein ACFU7Z_09865 [Kitasatospora sp. NPDC057518]|uniref:hypothetical protein n=1 Tax=Kitasatospora sp. NPDC057518 TaxID=3346155 RepID=UPI0036BC7C20